MTKGTLVALRETDHTPRLLLSRTTAKQDDIENLIVLIEWTDKRGYAADWSHMKIRDMVMLREILTDKIARELTLAYHPEFHDADGPHPIPHDFFGEREPGSVCAGEAGSGDEGVGVDPPSGQDGSPAA